MTALEKLNLAAPDGARAEIYLHGAHVASWIPAGGTERLFLSTVSEFRPGAAIRGGVPVVFPQFSGTGPLQKHGFARNLLWELDGIYPQVDAVTARLVLRDNEISRQLWNHPYALSLTISVGGAELSMRLEVNNPGEKPFSFTAALHTYLRVDDISKTMLTGLGDRPFFDTVGGAQRKSVQTDPVLRFPAETDRIYPLAPSPLFVQDSTSRITIADKGFPDCVVWNPGSVLGAKIADLEPDGYKRFLCVEAALVVEPVALEPGETWQGEQTLRAESL